MRLFVAIEIDDTIRQKAIRLIATLRPHAPQLKWVRPEALHLTLKFIGDMKKNKFEPFCAALDTVRSDSIIRLDFARLFWIPNPRRPTVFWLGIHDDDALTAISAQIDKALTPLGVVPEQRPFRPHLTLARIRRDSTKDASRLIQAVEDLPDADLGHMETGEFFLIQSQLSPAGAKYTKLKRFGFAGPS